MDDAAVLLHKLVAAELRHGPVDPKQRLLLLCPGFRWLHLDGQQQLLELLLGQVLVGMQGLRGFGSDLGGLHLDRMESHSTQAPQEMLDSTVLDSTAKLPGLLLARLGSQASALGLAVGVAEQLQRGAAEELVDRERRPGQQRLDLLRRHAVPDQGREAGVGRGHEVPGIQAGQIARLHIAPVRLGL